MKRNPLHSIRNGLLVTALAFASVTLAQAEEPTAFSLIKDGNRYVGETAKDKVMLMRSEKSIGTLSPQTWYINYRSEFTSLKGYEVKFVGGKMADLDSSSKGGRPFDLGKLKIDSDKALDIATGEPILKSLSLKASRLTLERFGDSELPIWRVRLWAAKLKDPNAQADIGEMLISAEDGKVVKNDVKISKVD